MEQHSYRRPPAHFGKKRRVRGVNLSQQDVEERQARGEPPPPGFTGRWGGTYYYLGQVWFGHSGRLGS